LLYGPKTKAWPKPSPVDVVDVVDRCNASMNSLVAGFACKQDHQAQHDEWNKNKEKWQGNHDSSSKIINGLACATAEFSVWAAD
jgi:hypothetical protein